MPRPTSTPLVTRVLLVAIRLILTLAVGDAAAAAAAARRWYAMAMRIPA